MFIKCPNEHCSFHNKEMPVHIIDEQIYEYLCSNSHMDYDIAVPGEIPQERRYLYDSTFIRDIFEKKNIDAKALRESIEKEKSDIERVLETLENTSESRPMTTFEEEQEANAIISYQELVEAVRQKKETMAVSNKDIEVPNFLIYICTIFN